jgi:hypothetical protein
MGKVLGSIGASCTSLYLLFWAYIAHGRWDTIKSMDLNEIGDFLGGTFGPLAFLWLVLGYFQQGIELRQNSAALHLQAEELKQSVEAQRQMGATAADALKLEREKYEQERAALEQSLQPRFFFVGAGGGTSGMRQTWDRFLQNGGGECTEIDCNFFSTDPALRSSGTKSPHMPRGASTKLSIEMNPTGAAVGSIRINYVDLYGRQGTRLFAVEVANGILKIDPI